MSSLRAHEFTLQRLLAELQQQRAELLAAPGHDRPDEAGYQTLSHKLALWDQRLHLLVRELGSREHLQALRGRQLHELPREARYAEQQSIASRLDEIQALCRVSDRIAATLQDIEARRHAPPTLHDLVRGVEDIARDWAERAASAQDLQQAVQAQRDGLSWRAGGDAARPLAPGELANLAVTSVMLVACLLRRLRR